MTKEELMVLLRDPDQTGQAVDELNRLIEGNPYFHTGHQLYLKGLQQTDESKMALQLRRTALSVRDRGVLYNYINRPSAFRQQPLPVDNPTETSASFVPGNSYISTEADISHIRFTHSEPVLPQLNVDEKSQNTKEQFFAEENIMSDDQLMDIVRRQLDEIPPPTEEKQQTPPDVVAMPPQDVVIKEETTDDVVKSEAEKEATSYNDLIDVFLKSNPKIIPNDDRVYHVDLSESLEENQDIATDTLAEIYASQGHIDKAVEIYEHLVLKYPEKHIYFAAQIERLKVKK